MTKTNKNVSLDLDAYLKAKELNINISEACNKGLREAVTFQDINGGAEHLREEAKELETQADVIEKKHDAAKKASESYLIEFDNMDRKILNNGNALSYWARRTNISVDDLIKRKKEQQGVI